MSTPSTDLLIVSLEQEAHRLDKLLASQFPHHSRTYFQFLIEQGCVLVNGQKIKKREKLTAGDEIEICFLLTPECSLEPENIPLDILFEDEHLLAINKPAGLVVHPAPGHFSHTFVNALLFHCKTLEPIPDSTRPGIVHRLDKETTGVLLAAKTIKAHQRLVSLFCQREIKKHYLAVCIGNPGDGTIQASIKRHPVNRKEMTVCEEGGKEAISRCQILKNNGKLTLVKIELVTGRTHQIRVHLKHRGTPILGDPVYGSMSSNQTYGVARQLLHAHTLDFIHPFTNQPIHLKAPLPHDMLSFLHKMNLFFE